MDGWALATGVLAEAHFFGLWDLFDTLEPLAQEESLQADVDPPIRRKELVSSVI